MTVPSTGGWSAGTPGRSIEQVIRAGTERSPMAGAMVGRDPGPVALLDPSGVV